MDSTQVAGTIIVIAIIVVGLWKYFSRSDKVVSGSATGGSKKPHTPISKD